MRISGTATVPASVGEVFGYMDVPENQAAITPGLIRSQLVERLDNGGSRVAYTYRLFGLTYRG
ncbi:SRPBCC family protein, partial [Halobacteriales archaeon SW_7_68_16]